MFAVEHSTGFDEEFAESLKYQAIENFFSRPSVSWNQNWLTEVFLNLTKKIKRAPTKLENVTLPTTTKFGTFQIEGMNATYFRFYEKDGKLFLERDFFIVAEREASKRQHPMSTAMYNNLQHELSQSISLEW